MAAWPRFEHTTLSTLFIACLAQSYSHPRGDEVYVGGVSDCHGRQGIHHNTTLLSLPVWPFGHEWNIDIR